MILPRCPILLLLLAQLQILASFTFDDDHFSPSESKNEREDRSDFDNEKAKAKFDHWVVILPLYNRKMLAVMLMETLQKRIKVGSTQAALEAAWITGFNEKTVRTCRKEFFERGGEFRDEAYGKYKRLCLLNEESLQLEACMWIHENAVKKGLQIWWLEIFVSG